MKSLLTNRLRENPLTIAVDARTLMQAGSVERGIGKYTKNHLMAVISQTPKWHYILLCDNNARNSYIDRLTTFPNVKVDKFRNYNGGVDLFHIPDPMSIIPFAKSPFRILAGVPISVVVHDLIPLILRKEYLDLAPAGWRREYLSRVRMLQQSGVLLLANSRHTAKDLTTYLGIPSGKITVIMAGINRFHRGGAIAPREVEGTLRSYGLTGPFFLSVGSLEPRKNFAVTLKAFMAIRASWPAQLAVVGSENDPQKGYFRNLAQALGATGVVNIGYISRQELEHLYTGATALIFPSQYEGFGLPVLEAMACGCPVIAGNAASIPEVAGDAAILIPPKSPEAVAKAMADLLADSSRREDLVRQGLEQAKKFTWERVAQKTIGAFEEYLAKRPGRVMPPPRARAELAEEYVKLAQVYVRSRVANLKGRLIKALPPEGGLYRVLKTINDNAEAVWARLSENP